MKTKKVSSTLLAFPLILAMMLMNLFMGGTPPVFAAAEPMITTDFSDYLMGGTVNLSGSNWPPNAPVHIHVIENVDPGWVHDSSPDPVADSTGYFKYTFTLADYFVATYTATATSGVLSASTSFTDANASADLDQCANDSYPSPNTDGCSAAASDWVNGNLGASKAVYFEGDSIPYRLRFDNLALASHTVTIEWDTTKSGKHALDYLTTFNRTVATANPCLGVTGCNPLTFTSFPIPADPQVTGAGVTPIAGSFRLYGGIITAVSAYGYADGTGFAGDKSARISITFTPILANPVLAWGGHISSRADWGANNSAVAIPGSPYHTRLIDLDGSGGNQDRSLSADAVIFPGSITVIKDATPNGTTSFGFTATPNPPLSNFSLVDDGTSANTKVFSNIVVFQTYTVNESSIPAGWGFDSVSCAVTTPNGGSYSTSTTTVNIAMEEGENWTCTYLDSQRTGTLTVIKHVVNDNGGTATANQWSLHVKSGVNEVSGSPQAGSESGTSYTLNAGTYTVSETGGVSGYTFTGFSGDCDSSGNVSVVAGQNKTCTLTNNDQTAHLKLVKLVVNDNGGTAVATDWTLSASGPTPISGAGGVESDVSAGNYSLSESAGPAGYAAGAYDCGASVTLALGESKTCTITNNDIAPKLHLRKVVLNNNGGTAFVTDFTLTADGTGSNDLSGASPVDSGPGLQADTWALSETSLPGYTASAWACVGGTQNGSSITVGIGGEATCTITNDDQQATITVVKVVNNNHGGTAQPNDFHLTLQGNPVSSGVAVPVNPGTYTAGETMLSGYSFDGFSGDCDSNGDVSVALGQSKTCVLTNSDLQAYVIVKKVVVNNNGGSAAPDDFKLTLNGNAVLSDAINPVNPGTYTAGETQLSGYSFAGFSGDCNSSGAVNVALGQTKTCILTNDDQQAYITVIKVVNNNNGGTAAPNDFKLTLEGNAVTSGVAVPVNPGTYTAGETLLDGYSFSGFSGDCDSNGDVTVALGQSKTCTLTNDDKAPILHLRKTVVNDNGGTKTVADFTLTANGAGSNDLSGTSPVDSGPGLKADTWALSETTQYGYTASAWACVGGVQSGSNITLKVGEEATCTITNNDQPGTIIIIKNAKPAQGSFAFTTTGSGYNGFSLTGATTNNGNQNTQTLNAGTYTVKETTQLGWILTGIGGSTDPNTPYNCVVSGSGGSTGVGDLNTQTATISLKNGDTVTCTFENTGQGVTRTQGFWATHPQLAQIAWFGGSAFGHSFPGVANVSGIGNVTFCSPVTKNVDTLGKLMGGFWSDISKTTTGKKRSALDQARMQLLQQMLAAELNASAFGSVPSSGSFAAWEAAYCGTDQNAIKNALQQAASFNSAGDSSTFTPGTSADSKGARAGADQKYWDVLP